MGDHGCFFMGAGNDGQQAVIKTYLTPQQTPINHLIIAVSHRSAELQQRWYATRDPLRPTTSGVHPGTKEPEQAD
jgi:hypothetical protein